LAPTFKERRSIAHQAPLGRTLRYAVTAEPEVTADASRTIRFVLSDSSVARDGHTLATAGWNLDGYLRGQGTADCRHRGPDRAGAEGGTAHGHTRPA